MLEVCFGVAALSGERLAVYAREVDREIDSRNRTKSMKKDPMDLS